MRTSQPSQISFAMGTAEAVSWRLLSICGLCIETELTDMAVSAPAYPDSLSIRSVLPSRSAAGQTRSIAVLPSKHIPTLDSLRGVAILLVLLRHSVAGAETTSKLWSSLLVPLRLTWSGVDLFFVLSGFLIGGILLDARHSPRYFRTFYIRRAFRILPMYYVFLGLYFVRRLGIHLVPGVLGDASPMPIPLLSFVTFTQNFWMASFGWFGAWGIAATWSLAVEEQFYLTVPFLIRNVSTRRLYAVLGCIIIAAPILRAVLPHLMEHGDFANYVLTPCRADALSMGVVAALLYRNPGFKIWLKRNTWVLYSVLLLTFVGILYLTGWAWEQYTPPMATWGLSCLALFYTCMLLSVVCQLNPIAEGVLRLKPLMKLGTVAYCTYLVHPVLMQAARTLLRSHLRSSPAVVWPLGGLLGIGASLVVAYVSWTFFERPLVRYGHEFPY